MKNFEKEWLNIIEHFGATSERYTESTVIHSYNHVLRQMFLPPQAFQSECKKYLEYVHDLVVECINEIFTVNQINGDLLDKCGIGECMKKKGTNMN